MGRLFTGILTLLLFLMVPAVIQAQDFEDPFADDYTEKETETETPPEEETESSETETTEPETTEEKDPYEDDIFADETEEDKRLKELDRIEAEKEKERLRKEQEAAEKKRQEEERKRKEAAAEAERNLREAKKKAEKVKREKYGTRLAERKKSIEYSQYYSKVMQKGNIISRLPGRTGFAFSAGIGFQANTANAVNEGFSFSEQLPFYFNNGVQFTSIQFSAPGIPQNKGVAHVSNLFQRQVNEINAASNGDDAEVEKSSGSISTFPVTLSAVYYGSFFLARGGVNFHHSLIGLGGTNRFTFSLPFSATNERVFIEHKTTLVRLEVPLSFALRILSSRAYGAYLGGGPSLYWGQNKSTISSTEDVPLSGSISGAFESETDSFSAFALGFHFLLGIEAQLFNRTYMVVELFQNFGTSGFVQDSDIGERSTSASGSAESDRPDQIKLNFSGTEILVSVRYFI